MGLIRKETFENIPTATPSQPVVGYIHKFCLYVLYKKKCIPSCQMWLNVARSYHTDMIKATVGFIKGELAYKFYF
jgi:hypothetical protein